MLLLEKKVLLFIFCILLCLALGYFSVGFFGSSANNAPQNGNIDSLGTSLSMAKEAPKELPKKTNITVDEFSLANEMMGVEESEKTNGSTDKALETQHTAWTLGKKETTADKIEVYNVQVDPALTDTLNTQDVITLPVPGFEGGLTAKIKDTHNTLLGVNVWRGDMQYDAPINVNNNQYEGHADDNIVIAKGKTATHITVVTRKGTYTTIYNNETGKGTLVNEAQYMARQSHKHDTARRGSSKVRHKPHNH